MKTTITIEIETSDFNELHEIVDLKKGENPDELDETYWSSTQKLGEVVFDEKDFHDKIKDFIEYQLEDDSFKEYIMDDCYPEEWNNISDIGKVSIKVNGKLMSVD